jgi:hypothetical protein
VTAPLQLSADEFRVFIINIFYFTETTFENCYTVVMTKTNSSKTHTSSKRKKSSKKVSSSVGKSKRKSKAEDERKLAELTIKMFQTVYDDYQEGKFHRIFPGSQI